MKLIITVDTEGDNLWKMKQCPTGIANITNRNGEYIERFQILCEKYKFIPTYFVNYEMTQSISFVNLGRDALKKKKCEIGMHMHAWNSPPIMKLSEPKGKKYGKPYAGEYPKSVLFSKMEYLHKRLEDIFCTSITSHRGGRWYFNEDILEFLIKYNYLVDATITPGLTWEKMYGNTIKGCNDKNVKMNAYELDEHNILKEGKSGILEVPPTILKLSMQNILRNKISINKDVMKYYWLRPDGNNLKEMLWIIDKAFRIKMDYIQFMIHSSELMPGGSPVFQTKKSIENLYYDLEVVFALIAKYSRGVGISDYAKKRYK